MKLTRIIILIYIFSTCIACSKTGMIENVKLQDAIAQVWLDAKTAKRMLDEVDVSKLSEYEQHRYRLTEAHLMLKLRFQLPKNTNLDALAEFLMDYSDATSAGEAYYIQGAYLNWLGENTRAMQYLKEAERCPTTSII